MKNETKMEKSKLNIRNIKKSPFYYVGLSILVSVLSMLRPAFFLSEKFRRCNAGGWPEGECFGTAIGIPVQAIIVLLLVIMPFSFASIAKSKINNTKFKKTLLFFDVVAFLLAVISIVKMLLAF